MMGVAAATQTGSAVPVMSMTIPGRIPPAPSDAPCSSPVPTTTLVRVVSPSASAATVVSGPTTEHAGRISPSLRGSMPAASSIRCDHVCAVTS